MKKTNIRVMLPVLFSFFIMGFCDAVGISSNYVKQDFGLSELEANYLPSMVFIWFFIFSVPVGLLMNKIGRKTTVMLSLMFTILATIIPCLFYTFPMMLFAFALLGIGNTILQVSLNPLISNIASASQLTSTLTAGQFVKAISSFCAPFIASLAAMQFGNWKLMFLIFALLTVFTACWLWITPVQEEKNASANVSFFATFALLGNKSILFLFLGILFLVGVDVGMNVVSPKLLMEKAGMPLNEAGYATSVYFMFRTMGAFIGAFILAKISPFGFFRINIFIALAALAALIPAQEAWLVYTLIAAIGFTCANVFSILFAAALRLIPSQANEISGLMIMGVSGGALIPMIMGYFSQLAQSTSGGLFIICFCMIYLAALSVLFKPKICAN